MGDDVLFHELEVIGTTTPLEDLPRRLSPVYQRRGAEHLCYFPVDGDGETMAKLSPEPAEYFNELVTYGDGARFNRAISALPGYCLILFERGSSPEYLPARDLPLRLVRASREALECAARAISEGRRKDAVALSWYARRADHDDPLPLLLLIALLRDDVPAEELRFLEQDLDEYPRQLVQGARRRGRDRAELAALADLINEPPQSSVRPTYLAPYQSKPSFLRETRSLSGRHAAA